MERDVDGGSLMSGSDGTAFQRMDDGSSMRSGQTDIKRVEN
jgi:hypothetical protein